MAAALRAVLREGYSGKALRADLMAGAVVGVVALPLSMALAIASGVPPQQGLYTAIIGGLVIAALGGSRVQVSGPTAAFVVILAPISASYGIGGLMLATLMAGVFLAGMGLARLGRLIQFIPNPVTTGFTSGIAVVIATLQVKDLLGLRVEGNAEHYIDRVIALGSALPTVSWPDAVVGAFTLGVLVLWPRITRRVPAPLVALTLAAVAAAALEALVPGAAAATINDRFSYETAAGVVQGIPQLPPVPVWPWTMPGPGGAALELSWETVRALMGPAFAIAMLGAIESLLSAVVADGMTGHKHDPDAELLAQGVGNIVSPFFGGIAATGAIARTATNIRSGGTTPVASMSHALVVLVVVIALAPALGYLPMAALAALLLIVAWNMSEVRHFAHVVRVAPKSDVIVLVACFGLTVIFDMVVAVTVGVMLAALLFMRRMAEVSAVKLVATDGVDRSAESPTPSNVMVYEIAGPLFFGAAHKAFGALDSVHSEVRAVVLDLHGVPMIDATGLVNLQSSLSRLHKHGIFVAFVGVGGQVQKVLTNAGLGPTTPQVAFCASVAEALRVCERPPSAG